MHQSQRIEHKATGATGKVYGRNKKGLVHCLMDSGEFQWFAESELQIIHTRKLEPSLMRASQLTGRPPDELLHFAKSCGLTLGQVVEALT